MTRVLFLGNSHLAALREAHVRDPDRWPGVTATFIGAHKDLLLQTTVGYGRFQAATPAATAAFRKLNGIDGVDLGDVDHIVICGCLVAVSVAASLWRDARWPALPSVQRADDLAGAGPVLISDAAAKAGLAGALASRLGLHLIRHLRSGTDLPITLSSQPRSSAAIATKSRVHTRAQNALLTAGDAAQVSALFDAAAAAACAQAGASWLPQPPQTIAQDILTDIAFMRGATRLTRDPGTAPQPLDDVSHANAAYGATVLDQVAGVLG